jgi:hypothetical protein
VHVGFLSLDRPISIDTDLISRITWLLTQGKDPNSLFADKKTDRALSKITRKNFHTVRGVHGLDVTRICNPTVRLETHALACKLLRKCRKDQVPVRVIVVIEKCVEGTSMRWAPYLLNQFLLDYAEAQDRGMELHYPWLLILIVFIAWEELEEAQFLGLQDKPCLAAKY